MVCKASVKVVGRFWRSVGLRLGLSSLEVGTLAKVASPTALIKNHHLF